MRKLSIFLPDTLNGTLPDYPDTLAVWNLTAQWNLASFIDLNRPRFRKPLRLLQGGKDNITG